MVLAFAILLAASNPAQTDGEVWNEGVAFYEQGDVTNALRVLRPLMLSPSHGARASEVVAKLEYDRGNLEEAAKAAQAALRATPDDARRNRNFTRATDKLPEVREHKRVQAILQAAQGKDPGAMLMTATRTARALMTEAATVRTNAASLAVAKADRMETQAQQLADVWIPLRDAISKAVTNEEQASSIGLQIDRAERNCKRAARELGDLDVAGYGSIAEAEKDLTRFLKLTISPPEAMAEDSVAQSNAWQDVEAFNGRPWQAEALDYTRAFRARFPAWARAYEQQAQADTNKPPFTAEDQAKVSALATELEKVQLECQEKELPSEQEKALGLIGKIRDLLPKDGGGQNQQQNQDRQQDQNQQQDQKNPQQDQKDQQQDSQENQQQEQKQDQPQRQEEQASAEKEQDAKDRQELEAILKKAQERTDEHEEAKRAIQKQNPLPPNERDW